MADTHQRFDTVTRIEVIDNYGRTYTSHNTDQVWIALQDDGKTLKIFHTGDTSHGMNTQHRDALVADLMAAQTAIDDGDFNHLFDDTVDQPRDPKASETTIANHNESENILMAPSTFVTLKSRITLAFGDDPTNTITGELVYDTSYRMLMLHNEEGVEYLSTNLDADGFIAEPGQAWIKDWSEHTGVAQQLINANVADEVRRVTVGPFRAEAICIDVKKLP